MPIFVVLFAAFILCLPIFHWSESQSEKENAEFEAKNCPEMLQVESKFCKPLEDKKL